MFTQTLQKILKQSFVQIIKLKHHCLEEKNKKVIVLVKYELGRKL